MWMLKTCLKLKIKERGCTSFSILSAKCSLCCDQNILETSQKNQKPYLLLMVHLWHSSVAATFKLHLEGPVIITYIYLWTLNLCREHIQWEINWNCSHCLTFTGLCRWIPEGQLYCNSLGSLSISTGNWTCSMYQHTTVGPHTVQRKLWDQDKLCFDTVTKTQHCKGTEHGFQGVIHV